MRSCMGMCAFMCRCVCSCTCVHSCASMCACMSVHVCVCVSVCVCMHAYICVCVCACVCVPPQAGNTVHSYALVCVFFESFSDPLQPAMNQLHWRSSTILKGEVLQGERELMNNFCRSSAVFATLLPLHLLSYEGYREKPVSWRHRGCHIQSKQQCDGKISSPYTHCT